MLVSISLVKIDSSSLCECLNCCTCSSHDCSVGCATDKGLALKKAWNSSSHGHHGWNHVCVCWLCWSCYQFYSTLWYGSVELALRRRRCEISKLTRPSKAISVRSNKIINIYSLWLNWSPCPSSKALLVWLSEMDHVLDFAFRNEQKAKGEIEFWLCIGMACCTSRSSSGD